MTHKARLFVMDKGYIYDPGTDLSMDVASGIAAELRRWQDDGRVLIFRSATDVIDMRTKTQPRPTRRDYGGFI